MIQYDICCLREVESCAGIDRVQKEDTEIAPLEILDCLSLERIVPRISPKRKPFSPRVVRIRSNVSWKEEKIITRPSALWFRILIMISIFVGRCAGRVSSFVVGVASDEDDT